jgi:hypothetical protein
VSIVVRTVALMRDARGSGSLRQRRPGVWEVRVAVGPDPVSGRPRYRSLTVHGDRQSAQAARQRWAAKAELLRGPVTASVAGHPGPIGAEVPPPCRDNLTEAEGRVLLRRLRIPDGSAETGWHVVVYAV